MRVSTHGEERIRKRIGINKKSAERQARLALERGLYEDQLSGYLRQWVQDHSDSVQYSPKTCVLYNNALFIYGTDNVLVTSLKIPQHIQKLVCQEREKANDCGRIDGTGSSVQEGPL